ncbi:MAG: FkbM family methyltransferase [Rhabdaerophilum sp.]
MRVPAFSRLWNDRQALQIENARLSQSLASDQAASPFFVYNSAFDAIAIIHRHAAADVSADPGYLTNFLGVKIDPKFFPTLLQDRAGQVEGVPVPANWHADIAEWAAAFRAVELAGDRFVVVELGCGWGCWLNNSGVAARRLDKSVTLIGIEGDEGHIGFAREATAANGFDPKDVELHHGIAAAQQGQALFPRQAVAGEAWGLKPVFGASDAAIEAARRNGTHDILPMISLDQISEHHPRIDLLHIDIQGGEADLIEACLKTLNRSVRFMLVGTHSREIEGRIFETMRQAGWALEIERPALLTLGPDGPYAHVDGVQGWRNVSLF